MAPMSFSSPPTGRGLGSRLGQGLLWFYSVLLLAFVVLPVAVLVLFSFQAGSLPVPPFTGPSLRWYEAVLADRRLMAALGNSLLVAGVSSAVATLLGFLAAYGFARFALPAAGLLRVLIIAPVAVGALVVGLGLLVAANTLGIPKSLTLAGVGHVVLNLPLTFALIAAQMSERQQAAERAARDLGAAEWQVLGLVTAPMLWPALFASFFLAVTFSWDEFLVAFLLTRFETTLPVELWAMLRSGLSPKANAAGSLVFLVSVLLVVALELVLARRRG